MSILCLGEILVDLVSPQADATLANAHSFVKAPGGAPANVAVGLARLGIPTRFAGCVGADPFGDWLRAILQAEQVNVAALQTASDARTTLAFVATRGDGKKDISFYRNPGADALLTTEDLGENIFVGTEIFHCGSVSLSLQPFRGAQMEAVRRAREANVTVSFDPNWRPSLWADFDLARELIQATIQLCDIVKIADEEWELVTGTADWSAGLDRVLDAGPRLVIITRGGDGVIYATRDFRGEIAAHPVTVVDTLGAGDAFVAGLLSQIANAESFENFIRDRAQIHEAARFANACGALATQKTGAIPALPTLAEVENWLASV